MTFGRPGAIPDHYLKLGQVQPISVAPEAAEQQSVQFFSASL
jgi:hypothetical protein